MRPTSGRTFRLQGWFRCLPLRTEKVEELVLFFSQHLANQIALVIRDRRIGEEPLVQQNIFLADKYVEGQHHTSPTAATLEHHTSKSSDDSQELTYETILAQEKPILAIFDERAVADCRGNLQYRRNRWSLEEKLGAVR